MTAYGVHEHTNATTITIVSFKVRFLARAKSAADSLDPLSREQQRFLLSPRHNSCSEVSAETNYLNRVMR